MLLRYYYYDDIPKDVFDKDEREAAIQLRNLVKLVLRRELLPTIQLVAFAPRVHGLKICGRWQRRTGRSVEARCESRAGCRE